MVRQRLENDQVVWYPRTKKLAQHVEGVQRRATALVRSIAHLSYDQRIRKLGLFSLQYRHQRNDTIHVWKLLNGKLDGEFPWLNLDTDSRVRGHSLKLRKDRSEASHLNFSYRVVNEWNSLSDTVVTAKTVDTFEKRLDKFWADRIYEHPLYL